MEEVYLWVSFFDRARTNFFTPLKFEKIFPFFLLFLKSEKSFNFRSSWNNLKIPNFGRSLKFFKFGTSNSINLKKIYI